MRPLGKGQRWTRWSYYNMKHVVKEEVRANTYVVIHYVQSIMYFNLNDERVLLCLAAAADRNHCSLVHIMWGFMSAWAEGSWTSLRFLKKFHLLKRFLLKTVKSPWYLNLSGAGPRSRRRPSLPSSESYGSQEQRWGPFASWCSPNIHCVDL